MQTMRTFPDGNEVAVFPKAFECGFIFFGLSVDELFVLDQQLLDVVADVEQMLLHVSY